MTVYATPGERIYPSVDWGTTGATLGLRIRRNTDGTDVVARGTTGIVESPASSGIYVQQTGIVAPTTGGNIYDLVWDDGANFAVEDLVVTSSAPGAGATGQDLCSLSQVREYLQKPAADTAQDALISSMISRASAAIEEWTQRWLAPRTAVTQTFKVDGLYVDFAPYDLRTATTVSLHPEGTPVVLVANTSYQLVPIGGTDSLATYTGMMLSMQINTYSSNSTRFGFEQVSVLGNWGPATIPLDITNAAIITTAAMVDRAAMAYAAPTSEDGRVIMPNMMGTAIPTGARELLRPYRRAIIG